MIDEDSISKTTYRYTYNANNNLLYLALIKHEFSSSTDSEETFSIECTNAKQLTEKETRLAELSETQFKILESYFTEEFKTKIIYQYEISDGTITAKLYFDGTLQTFGSFNNFDLEFENSFRIVVGMSPLNGGRWFWAGAPKYTFFPIFTGNAFLGTVYKWDEEKYNGLGINLGTAKGTFTTSGKGTSGCTVSLNFTSIPEELSSYKDKEIILTQY